jgi:hypothetical protein
LAFCNDLRVANITELFRTRCSFRASADEMMLLVFGAGLISLFRFARTVTILQQIVRQLSVHEARRNVRQPIELISSKESRCFPLASLWLPLDFHPLASGCRRTGQKLALFPYLQQRPNQLSIEAAIPRTRDREC